MRKRILGTILTAALLFTGCGSGTTPEIIMPDAPMEAAVTDSAGSPEGERADSGTAEGEENIDTSGEYTVYLITMDMTDSYWQSIDSGCQKAAGEIGGITYKWIGPDSHDDALQSACIDQAVGDGADAILIAANSAEGVNQSLAKAAEAGCKIVYVDSAASYDCVTALATDNEAAGATAANAMMEELRARGIAEGTIGVFGVTADTASCVARETGFRSAFEGSGYTLADTVFMQDDAGNVKGAVADGLASGYVGFFGTNEGTTLATGEAAKEAGSDVLVVGFDTSDAVLSLVSEGVIFATMQQNPETMGYDGVRIAVQALEGAYTDTNQKTDTGVTVITRDVM
ncbi:MAG: substrate-binding domain-containing protein [Muribaculaceae bacterium]|nr:substrate-binding domain-containing protein [Roseburia sp.]MCM1431010.1 substrate-binding domain-containing protein [Muribaculaceae bacterium]MCM1493756.1 substrate-binding domain-containing protein [Muribaculaceae bacterium]